jgi:PfaB family protein
MNNITTHNALAVIGLDALFGAESNIDSVERAFYQGKANLNADLTEQQSLTELCAGAVARLARANNHDLNALNVIVISHQASQLEQSFKQGFRSMAVVANLYTALISAAKMLADDPTQAIAILGVNIVTRATNASDDKSPQATIAYDKSFESYQEVAGLAAVLLTSAQQAKRQACYVYSWINAFSGAEFVNQPISSAAIAQITTNAIEKANITPDKITLLEVSALADNKHKLAELDAMLAAYASSQKLHTAISCSKSVTGEGIGFSQVAGLLKTVIALQQHYIPGLNDWQSPFDDKLDNWLSSPFYFPSQARPWYPNAKGAAHNAAFSCLTPDSYCHLVLQENQPQDVTQDVRNNGYMACSDLCLLLLPFNDQAGLLAQLDQLIDLTATISLSISQGNSQKITLNSIAADYYERFKLAKDCAYRVCLIAETPAELLKEIRLAAAGVTKALGQQTEWKTPKGSFFSAAPVTAVADVTDVTDVSKEQTSNKVAFLYPGIGATYVGLGRDLFHLFPEIYQPVAALADDIGATLKDTLLNPRSISALDFQQIKQLDSDLRNNLANIAECGVAFACVFTKIFEDVFNISADYSAGYSMGEVSMYAALGCWENPGQMSARLANSETFNNRLSGQLTTLRALWDLPLAASLPKQQDEKIWETYSIRATLAQVTQAAKHEQRVFCTIVNTPDNLLIGGYPEDCERVIKNLGVRAMAMDMPNAIHSKPAHADYADMASLFSMDVTKRIKTKMLSSSCYLPIPHRSKAIANSIAKCLCDQVDFPRLINSLHDRGARVFVEMGPGRSLCSWTDKILKHGQAKAHASVPVNAKGTSDELTYLRALAKLISHGVAADLEKVFNGSIIVQN